MKLFHVGGQRDLELDDLYRVLPEDRSQSLGSQLENAWKKQLLRCEVSNKSSSSRKKKKPSLTKAIVKVFGLSYAFLGIFAFIDECVIKYVHIKLHITLFTTCSQEELIILMHNRLNHSIDLNFYFSYIT